VKGSVILSNSYLVTPASEKLKKAQSVLKDINNYAKRVPVLICAITKKTYSDNGNHNMMDMIFS
jgi:hypothetical protein